MFALVDGNNFYVSCERVFRPALNDRPVIVLSNNDGCAIARSDEAKALGIKMGQPFYQIQQNFRDREVIALSANFSLYGDMSNRMMGLVAGLGPTQEIYSIDECFIGLEGVSGDLKRRAHVIRNRLTHWLGLPAGIGIGPTKTLAKLANHIAKNAIRKPGSYPLELGYVCDLNLLPASDLDTLLQATPIADIWGIGRRLSQKMQAIGLHTAYDLAHLNPALARKRWSVVVERTVRELQGESCLSLEEIPSQKQQIACTRSFGQKVHSLDTLTEAITEFVSRAAQKLRQQRCLAGDILVFIRTSPFRREDKQYAPSIVIPLPHPSASTLELAQAARQGLNRIYRPGYAYAKAGVILLDLTAQQHQQHSLDFTGENDNFSLMNTVDRINRKYGRGTIGLATSGLKHHDSDWHMRQTLRTPRYTTHWHELPFARA